MTQMLHMRPRARGGPLGPTLGLEQALQPSTGLSQPGWVSAGNPPSVPLLLSPSHLYCPKALGAVAPAVACRMLQVRTFLLHRPLLSHFSHSMLNTCSRLHLHLELWISPCAFSSTLHVPE